MSNLAEGLEPDTKSSDEKRAAQIQRRLKQWAKTCKWIAELDDETRRIMVECIDDSLAEKERVYKLLGI
jgi:ABC-type nitrate/sulfonate/bicarbonate transport system substrate-binding protein